MTNDEATAKLRSLNAKVDRYRANVADCREKITQLKRAYKKLEVTKDSFIDLRKNEARIIDGGYRWCGKDHDRFTDAGGELDSENKNYINNHLDAAMDEINLTIAYFESRKTDWLGLINALKEQATYFWTQAHNEMN